MSFLQDHPFAVEAFFERSMVLTFAVPKELLQPLIPACLELDTWQDKWAFFTMALVETKDLRPAGFPKFSGNDFFLIGYRLFVKYHTNAGKRLRGLYILKSETDKKKMEIFGNIFTHYKYGTTDIIQTKKENELLIRSQKSDFSIRLDLNENADVDLPTKSVFTTWKEARRFAGPLPFTFTYDEKKKEVLIIEGQRENWEPRAVQVIDYDISFLKNFNFGEINLANAFVVENIPYRWQKGRKEIWQGQGQRS